MTVKSKVGRYFGRYVIASDAIKSQGEFIKSTKDRVSLRGTPKIMAELWRGPASIEEGQEAYIRFMEGVRPTSIPEIRKSMIMAASIWAFVCLLMIAMTAWSLAQADSFMEVLTSLLSIIPILGTLLMTLLMWRRVKIIDMKRVVGLRELLA